MACLEIKHLSSHKFAFCFNFNFIADKAGSDAQRHTSMPISSIFSVDMITRWKDFTIANVGHKPRFTTNDDIRLDSVNEAPQFFFLSTYTLKVYYYNSMVGGIGLDWLHVLRW